jgi:hypothetical protein
LSECVAHVGPLRGAEIGADSSSCVANGRRDRVEFIDGIRALRRIPSRPATRLQKAARTGIAAKKVCEKPKEKFKASRNIQ